MSDDKVDNSANGLSESEARVMKAVETVASAATKVVSENTDLKNSLNALKSDYEAIEGDVAALKKSLEDKANPAPSAAGVDPDKKAALLARVDAAIEQVEAAIAS